MALKIEYDAENDTLSIAGREGVKGDREKFEIEDPNVVGDGETVCGRKKRFTYSEKPARAGELHGPASIHIDGIGPAYDVDEYNLQHLTDNEREAVLSAIKEIGD